MQVVGICPVDGQWLTTRTLSSCRVALQKEERQSPNLLQFKPGVWWGIVRSFFL